MNLEIFESACKIKQDIAMHPFAFRTHTHKLGKINIFCAIHNKNVNISFKGLVNSAYRVRGRDDDQEWTEIGRRSPQLPQMFYPIDRDVTIRKGDYVAAACTMYNFESHIVRIGYEYFVLLCISVLFVFFHMLVQLVMMKCVISI